MSFYEALQMDPSILKRYIAKGTCWKEKRFYWVAMAVRSVLIVAFAIGFIGGLSVVFGQENTPFAVALFCIFLGIRFVNFAYCMKDSLVALAVDFAILLFVPSIVAVVPAPVAALVHFVSFFVLLFLTTQQPQFGNGGLYSFAYVYLTGNPVFGAALGKRALLALLGYGICALLLYRKHRHLHAQVRLSHWVNPFGLHQPTHLWQVRMALGTGILLAAGQFFGVERFMWMGFACASLLSEYPYAGHVTQRFWQRVLGAVVGSGLFFLVYQITPASFHSLLGPLGGFCLGFCTDYRYKTAVNCFGALMLASGIYGVQGAVALRVLNTLWGAVFALLFAFLFHQCVGKRFAKETV